MSVRANISVAALLENSVGRVFINPAWERRGAAKIASDVALVGGPAAGIETLSGGNQQKALLARWLLRGVDLLLLDEPTAGIDVHARAEIHQLLRRLAHSGATIVMASVEPEELALECDRVLVLVEGEITQELRAPFDVDRVVAASYGRRRPAA
jgi:ribose transport system ATP-binding protein